MYIGGCDTPRSYCTLPACTKCTYDWSQLPDIMLHLHPHPSFSEDKCLLEVSRSLWMAPCCSQKIQYKVAIKKTSRRQQEDASSCFSRRIFSRPSWRLFRWTQFSQAKGGCNKSVLLFGFLGTGSSQLARHDTILLGANIPSLGGFNVAQHYNAHSKLMYNLKQSKARRMFVKLIVNK